MEDFFNALPRLIWHEDEPSRAVQRFSILRVTLGREAGESRTDREGSDELFGGYERYRWNLINQRAWAVADPLGTPRRIARYIDSQAFVASEEGVFDLTANVAAARGGRNPRIERRGASPGRLINAQRSLVNQIPTIPLIAAEHSSCLTGQYDFHLLRGQA